MACAYSTITKLLLLLILLQWTFVVLLLVDRSSRTEQFDCIDHSFQKSFKMATSRSMSIGSRTTNTRPEFNDERQQTFAGVSVTLMLNAPKWFQRRYTGMISNVLMNTPRDWAVQIFYTPQGLSQIGLDINPGLVRLAQIYSDRLLLIPLPQELITKFGTAKKLKYWTDSWMWQHMVADRVFMFGGNGAMCSNSRRLSFMDASDSSSSSAMLFFSQLDYVGTPWNAFYGRGGDGAFSYRNRTAMLQAIQHNPHDGSTDETTYFIKTLLDMNDKIGTSFRVATKEQSKYFGGTTYSINSTETESEGPPIVISGTLAHLDATSRKLLIDTCPEIRQIFPSLDNPNCFGAAPNSEECAKSICALKDPKDRKGGC